MFSRTSLGSPNTDRLCIVNSHTGEAVPFKYDRRLIEDSLQDSDHLDKTLFKKLLPEFIERRMVAPSLWGAERHPDWKA